MSSFFPYLFVFLWSTGFIGAKFGLPYAGAFSFLSTRYILVLIFLAILARIAKAPWPPRQQWRHIAIAGLGIHGFYLAGVFLAIQHGLPSGITALVVGMQPTLTAALSKLILNETIRPRQWLGIVLGFIGVLLVVSGKLGQGLAGAALWPMLWPALMALVGITAGTLYQKRYCLPFDLRTGGFIQFLPTAIFTCIPALLVEHIQITWNFSFVFALMWLVFVLSIGAISLLNLLISSGSAANVASLFYLTPPTTALIAWLVFHETLTPLMIVGMITAAGGVYLARQMPQPHKPKSL